MHLGPGSACWLAGLLAFAILKLDFALILSVAGWWNLYILGLLLNVLFNRGCMQDWLPARTTSMQMNSCGYTAAIVGHSEVLSYQSFLV